MKTLHLVLTGYWYDLIKSGKKTTEYRLCNDYWSKKIRPLDAGDKIIFHRGYTNTTLDVFVIAKPRILLAMSLPRKVKDFLRANKYTAIWGINFIYFPK